jgi:YHS domain-containing protein
MIRFFFIRIVLPLLLFLLVRAVVKSIWGGRSARASSRPSDGGTRPRTGGELKKDPVCGTFVSASSSFTKTIDGEKLHFCSADCRDRYRAA